MMNLWPRKHAETRGRRLGQYLLVAALVALGAGRCFAQKTITQLEGLVKAGRFEEAEKGFDAHLQNNPDDPAALYYLGKLKANLPASTRLLDRVVNEFPDHDLADDALFALADAAYAGPLGLYLKARRLYERLVRRYPGSDHVPMSLYRIGLTHLIVHEAEAAAAAFRRVTAEHPTSAASFHARLGLAEVEAARGNLKKAIAAADSLRDAAPDSLRQAAVALSDDWRRRNTRARTD